MVSVLQAPSCGGKWLRWRFPANVFGEILQLIPLAETCLKLNALCVQCNDGTPAQFSARITNTTEQQLVGGAESYQAVCRKHLLEIQSTAKLHSKNNPAG